MLTKAKLAEYIERGELVPIGTELVTVELGRCKVVENENTKFPYRCQNEQGFTEDYGLDFRWETHYIHSSLIDHTPEVVASPFTRAQLARMFNAISAYNNPSYDEELQVINHLLSAPSEFPCEMYVWDTASEFDMPYIENVFYIDPMNRFCVALNDQQLPSAWKFCRPIPKVKTLADLVKGDKVWGLEDGYDDGGDASWKYGKSYLVTDVLDTEFCIIDESNEEHWLDFDKTDWVSPYPPTPAQITAAKQAAIEEVNRRFSEIEKEVGNG